MAYNDPLVSYCRSKGYEWEWQRDFEGNEDRRTVIIEFPCEFPETTRLVADSTAIKQLQMQAVLQRDWADNAVSVTVYYRDEELDDIKARLAKSWSGIKSVSFLRHQEHGFDQAPLEAITEAEYLERLAQVHDHGHRVLGGVSELLDADCEGGACPIR